MELAPIGAPIEYAHSIRHNFSSVSLTVSDALREVL